MRVTPFFLAGLLLIYFSGCSIRNSVPEKFSIEAEKTEANFFLPDTKEKIKIPTLTSTISAKRAIVYDLELESVISEKNADVVSPIGSLTKLMTAIVALKHFPPESVLRVRRSPEGAGGSTVGLQKGDQIRGKDLYYALLVVSGNDAAYVFADNHRGGVQGFLDDMNQTAREIGMENTTFTNVVGVDNIRHRSTANDLLRLAMTVRKNEFLSTIIETREKSIVTEKYKNRFLLKTTNHLLHYDRFDIRGMKTGTTKAAGQCLVALAYIQEKPILIILLGSDSRWRDTHFIINSLISKQMRTFRSEAKQEL